jgi:hypothetical protein
VQPGYGWSDHRAYYNGDEQGENDLVKSIKKPETKRDKNKHQSRPHDPPKSPLVWL